MLDKVIVGSGAMSQFACGVSVILFRTSASGVLCPTDRTKNDGWIVYSGFAPNATPTADSFLNVIGEECKGETYPLTFSEADIVVDTQLCG